MKINEISKTGFYSSEPNEPTFIFEVIENTDESWLKENPDAKFLIDTWLYDYTDENDRRIYQTDGSLEPVGNATYNVDVEEITETKFKMILRGNQLIEDKPTYKELANRYKEIMDYTESTINNFMGCMWDESCSSCNHGNCLDTILNKIKEIKQ